MISGAVSMRSTYFAFYDGTCFAAVTAEVVVIAQTKRILIRLKVVVTCSVTTTQLIWETNTTVQRLSSPAIFTITRSIEVAHSMA